MFKHIMLLIGVLKILLMSVAFFFIFGAMADV